MSIDDYDLDELLGYAKLFIVMTGGVGIVSIDRACIRYEVCAENYQPSLFEELS